MHRIYRLAAYAVLAANASHAQNTAGSPMFDAASVRIFAGNNPVRPGELQMKGGPGSSDPGRITWGRVQLLRLLTKAWDVENYQIAGPDWLLAAQGSYTITATMPPETTTQEFRLMLQNLLIERFQIRLHHETRMFPGYELVVAPGGSKVRRTADPDAPDPEWGTSLATGELDSQGFLVLAPGHNQGTVMGPDGSVSLKFQKYTIAEFADSPYLRGYIRQSNGSPSHVVDKTGLTGKYDFTLRFDARSAGAAPVLVGSQVRANLPAESDLDSGLPDIFKALEKQLGLKLVKAKGFALDTIVITSKKFQPIINYAQFTTGAISQSRNAL